MGALKDAWGLFQKVQGLLALQESHGKSIDVLKQGLADLDRRITRLEAREEMVVNEAKAAARAASYEASQGTLSDLARRVGGLEENKGTTPAVVARRASKKRLPPPD